MKTILVTGGYGFIGSCFVLQEIEAGNKIINLDKLTYAANIKNLVSVEGNPYYKFYKGDICDNNLVAKIFAENEIDCVVNFAAESHVDNSIEKPSEFIQTNIFGVYNLLQNALQYWKNLEDGKKQKFKFLHVSTDEVYGSLNLDSPKFSEITKYDPSSPYSASKAASDHLVNAWGVTYGLPCIITNCSNNFGPRQHSEKLIPKIITNCVNEKTIPIYGKGENIRDWIFVADHCAGIKLALEKGEVGESYCFGGNAERTNNQIVNLICEKMDRLRPRKNGESYKGLITYVKDRAGHDLRYAIDDSKAKEKLGYEQSKSFEARIEETIGFYL
jgi:dTDP-glucose 4,6-dehydratase